MEKTNTLREAIRNALTLGITGSPSTTMEIAVDITEESKTRRMLGQMVCTVLEEDGREILAIGQIVSVETKNRWHEDPSFKGVVKRYGKLPNLSGVADNRLAIISVQSCFDLGKKGSVKTDDEENQPTAHILGVSPSTGENIQKMTDNVLTNIVRHQRNAITYIGRVYGTKVHLPMWFKHFGKTNEEATEFGAGDAYHIGVFGRTGSGKTVASSLMLLGYAKNKTSMNILVLDPQGQFTDDRGLLPGNLKLKCAVNNAGMEYQKYNLVTDISLPDDFELFGNLLIGNRFIREAFGITTEDKQDAMRDCIIRYLNGRNRNPEFQIAREDSQNLLIKMLERFVNKKADDYLRYVYSNSGRHGQLVEMIHERISLLQSDEFSKESFFLKWREVFSLFSLVGKNGNSKTKMDDLVEKIVTDNGGNFIVLDLRPEAEKVENDNLKALFLRVIERQIAERGGLLYANDKQANCLIVMDEAHRFIAKNSPDQRIRELTPQLIDSVRTTRKYGIGHMFITQTLESLDDEMLKQMRIFAFGYGLTIGSELRKVKEIVNSDSAINLYKSFIDPISNGRYPFMFFGPVSPLSATGAPLFVEMYKAFTDFEKWNSKQNKDDTSA